MSLTDVERSAASNRLGPGALVEAAGVDRGFVVGDGAGRTGDVVVLAVSDAGTGRSDAVPVEGAASGSWPVQWPERVEVLTQESAVATCDGLVSVGTAADEAVVRVLRARLDDDLARFHAVRHRSDPFDVGSPRVPYAGRVFDVDELRHGLDATLEFGLTLGEHGTAFADGLASFLDVHRVVLVNSGSSANLLAISALTSPLLGDRALQPGDEVLTSAGGFPTTLNPILQAGLTPVLVDNDVVSGNVDVERLAEAVGPRTRAVMLAHTLGNPFDIDAVRGLCARHELWLVEDNCDALGSLYSGRRTGSFGDLSTQSFYPGHHITMGEGGAVGIRQLPLLGRAVESFRDWGRDCWCAPGEDDACGKRFGWQLGELPLGYDHKFTFSHIGYNLKPTDWQAAIGRAQLPKLEGFVAARRRNWDYLSAALAGLDDVFELPIPAPRSEPSWFGFKIVVRQDAPFGRDDVVRALEREGVQTRMVLGGNLARQPALQRLAADQPGRWRAAGPLDGADRLMADGFFVGVYPGLTEAHLEHMAAAITRFAATATRTR